jgi:heme/copper-type cytochrome/quinol oxidase subunit 4
MQSSGKHRYKIALGIGIGYLANTLGIILYILLFSPLKIRSTLQMAYLNGYLGSITIIGLGAVLNLLAFFAFIKLKKDPEAKGVLVATITAALSILILKALGL